MSVKTTLTITRRQAEVMMNDRVIFLLRNCKDLSDEVVSDLLETIDDAIEYYNQYNYRIEN